jgi:tetratricopeptide (TPR) repeat protein
MKKLGSITIGLLLTAMAITSNTAAAASTSELLQRGLYAEEVEGNMDAAIKAYGEVIKNSSAPQNHVAQALYRQGMCYLKIKDEQSAKAVLEKLVAQYPGQTEIVDKARPVLDDLTNFDPAALMPPGTLVYVEFGSPGRQIETILNTLKGTPFENPLAAMGGRPSTNPGQKSPGDIMAALLNPSMMAEFKKIRGSAIGITGIAQNDPPSISVLYPGKSDALRGLILAGLGMVGSPAEPIEGMQTMTITTVSNGGMEAAYDDKVIILAHPASQLQWCVKQYKGSSSEPTLASSNKSFAKLSKNQRQKNALTIWANVDEAYARLLQMFPAGEIPKGIQSANAIGDFMNIDDLVLTESIEPNGLSLRTDIQFKDGHHCLAYDMIRTPNIRKAALEAVPAEAIAVASFSLSQTDVAQADKVRTKIQSVTGLDVGREIFANIEQVTIFAMPSEGSSVSSGSPGVVLPRRLGLAITSRNPDQTRQILATLLGTANTMSTGKEGAASGQYKIGSGGQRDLYCYMEQINGTTLLSLNHEIITASVAAIKNHKSVCASGPLNSAVNKLAPSASKLFLVNAGGAMRLIGPQVDVATLDEEQIKQLNASFEQLAHAADSTTLELRTDEQLNNFGVNSGVTGIPPLNQVLGPATQFARLRSQARAEATARQLRSESPATLFPATQAPLIDGKVDDVWNAMPSYKLSNVLYTPPASSDDLSADYKAMWDEKNLYLLVDVTDDLLKHDSTPDKFYEDDSVEVYIDATDSKSAQYGETDYQYAFNWDKTSPGMQELKHNRIEGVQYALVTTGKGYRLEIKFPWSTLGTKPVPGARIGLDIHVNDNDSGGKRDTKITWHDRQDNAWENPRAFGNAEFAGLVGWWKFDETEGVVAADSSGNGHNGSLQGNPVWRPQGGRFGGAIELGGHGDYVKIGNESAFDITGQITIAAWVNIKSIPQEWTGIVTKGDSAWRMSTEYAQNAFHFGLAREDYLNGRANVSPGQWHHIACTYDGQKMSTYVDGRLDASRPRNGPIGTNDFPVCIGENIELTGHCWHGLIDDVRIYNYALSEGQVKALAAGQ